MSKPVALPAGTRIRSSRSQEHQQHSSPNAAEQPTPSTEKKKKSPATSSSLWLSAENFWRRAARSVVGTRRIAFHRW